jgi:uncharacterized protein
MKIQVAGLSEGVHAYHFDETASALGLGSEFSPVHVEAQLERQGEELILEGGIRTAVRCTCDRCLAEFTEELEPAYLMHYVHSEADAGRYDPAEVQVLGPDVTTIDLADDVRQTVLVAVPLKLLCRPSCKGLCPSCGKNWNEGSCSCQPEPPDSRWDALRTFRDSSEESGH